MARACTHRLHRTGFNMLYSQALSSLSPAVIVHLVLAAGAVLLGPLALSARKGSRRYRGFGYA